MYKHKCAYVVKLLGTILNIRAILQRWKLASGIDKVGRDDDEG